MAAEIALAPESTIGVTGATGFVGRALVAQLEQLDNVTLRLFSRLGGVAVGKHLTEAMDLARPDLSGIDHLVHLAGEWRSHASEAELMLANAALTEALARAAVGHGVKRFVLVSSIGVHGKSSVEMIRPDSPFHPATAYARSKVESETVARAVLAGSGTELAIVRPPMIYGEASDGSFAALARLARTGVPLPFGLASAPRSICSVNNVASALAAVATSDRPPPVLLPADPDDSSTLKIVLAARSAAGVKPRLLKVQPKLLALMLRAIGKSEMSASLLEPMAIDRQHWMEQTWRPVETADVAMARAFERLGRR